jgi:hypothetical protein
MQEQLANTEKNSLKLHFLNFLCLCQLRYIFEKKYKIVTTRRIGLAGMIIGWCQTGLDSSKGILGFYADFLFRT